MNGLVRYLLVGTPLAVLMFFVLAGFFDAWSGKAVSHRPARVEDPATLRVLVVDEDRNTTEWDWPADLVRSLSLETDRTGVPPTKLPEEAPSTLKTRFSLFFTVTPVDGESRIQPTTSARSLSVAALAWLLGLFLNNMWLSGSPFSFVPRETIVPNLAPEGGGSRGGAPPPPRNRGRQGPPPGKPRKGQGRRR